MLNAYEYGAAQSALNGTDDQGLGNFIFSRDDVCVRTADMCYAVFIRLLSRQAPYAVARSRICHACCSKTTGEDHSEMLRRHGDLCWRAHTKDVHHGGMARHHISIAVVFNVARLVHIAIQ